MPNTLSPKRFPGSIVEVRASPDGPQVGAFFDLDGARDSSTVHPGTVDVAVFPPIAVDDWTSANLSRLIDGVRQLYLDTLADWPVDELPKPKKRMARTKS